jgi:signal transduction histidine kinase
VVGRRSRVADADLLRARLAHLLEDRQRIFEEAQREADAVFAEYQLSQLLAMGGSAEGMARAVVAELARDANAQRGALWLTDNEVGPLRLVAAYPESPETVPGAANDLPPGRFAHAGAALAWCRRHRWYPVTLDERVEEAEHGLSQRTVGLVALWCPAGQLPSSGIEFLQRVRHELALAFRGAQWRDALVHERALVSAILDGASDAIVAVDRQRCVIRINPAARGFLGDPGPAARCDEFLGCRIADQPRGETTPPGGPLRCGSRCPFEQVLASGSPVVDHWQTLIGRDGTAVPVAASYARMAPPASGAVAVFRDLRGQLALEELRSSFVAAVSHDLRTPLALISGAVESLLNLDLDPPTRRRLLEQVARAAGRLVRLADEMLDLTRVDSGRLHLQREPTELRDLVRETCREFPPSDGLPDLLVELPDVLPPVLVDRARIGHVLVNLLDNAYRYGAVEGGRIVIGARRRGAWVEVSVRDDGPGIDPGERALVFERYYRGRQARTRGLSGTGLGLYLARRIVEAHGGRLWLKAVPKGAAVAFTVPVASEARGGAGRLRTGRRARGLRSAGEDGHGTG